MKQYDLKSRVVIGYAGSIVAYEGLDVLIKAVDICQRNGLNIALLIVGEGTQKKKLIKLASKIGVEKHVHFTGKVRPDEIPQFLSLFDICVLARLDLPICHLVPPLKPLEIMAAGKPLIVSRLAPLLVYGVEGESRLSFKAGDTQALASQISRLVKDKPLCNHLGQQAQKWVRDNGSWEKNANIYAQLYKEIIVSINSSVMEP